MDEQNDITKVVSPSDPGTAVIKSSTSFNRNNSMILPKFSEQPRNNSADGRLHFDPNVVESTTKVKRRGTKFERQTYEDEDDEDDEDDQPHKGGIHFDPSVGEGSPKIKRRPTKFVFQTWDDPNDDSDDSDDKPYINHIGDGGAETGTTGKPLFYGGERCNKFRDAYDHTATNFTSIGTSFIAVFEGILLMFQSVLKCVFGIAVDTFGLYLYPELYCTDPGSVGGFIIVIAIITFGLSSVAWVTGHNICFYPFHCYWGWMVGLPMNEIACTVQKDRGRSSILEGSVWKMSRPPKCGSTH